MTSGGKPRSSRTRGISASTSFMRFSAPCSLSWLARLEIIPPGTWLTCTRVSTAVNSLSNWWYFLRTAWKYMPISWISDRSRPVSYSLPLSAATIDSVPGWLVPQAKLEIAVSIWSAPASMAFSWHIEPRPAVSWLWMKTGRSISAFSALTSSAVAKGVSSPAMSLMAMESMPMACMALPWATNAATVCTGLVV